MFVTLLILNSILQIDSIRGYRVFHRGRSYDDNDLIASERRAVEDNDNDQKLFTKLLNRLKEEDRQNIQWMIQLTALVEGRSCIEDEEKRTKVGGDYYNTFADMYPSIKYQYQQFLKELNEADQALLQKMVDKTKTTASETCKSLYNAG
jgi:hypothetical protein